jgi:hypothetical protein
LYDIKPEKQLELLRWMLSSQEAQWLLKVSAAMGPGESVKLSGKVRSALGRVEMKAMLALLNKHKADNLADAVEVLKSYLKVGYGDRGWSGFIRQPTQERAEFEITRWVTLENLRKATSGSPEALALAAEMMWSNWFEVLLPESQVEVTVQLAGTAGRESDLFTVTCFTDEPDISPVIEIEPVTPTPAPMDNPVAAALSIPLGEESLTASPAAPIDYTSYVPPVQTRNTPTVQETVPTSWPTANPAPIPTPPVSPPVVVGGTLAQRMASKRAAETNAHPVPETTASVNEETPPPIIRLDSKTARPLFTEDMEQQVKDNISRGQMRKNKIFQKLMISREGRKLIEEGADKPTIPEFNLAAGIEEILQRLILRENARNPGSIPDVLHVISEPDGELVIQVDKKIYKSLTDIPDGPVRELIEDAIAMWGDSQKR